MTDRILELAKEAGFEIVDGMIDLGEHSDYTATESLKAFANLIRQDEREQYGESIGEIVLCHEPEWMKPRETIKWNETEFPLGTKFYAKRGE